MDNPVGDPDTYELNNLVDQLEWSGLADEMVKLLRLEWVTGSLAGRSRLWQMGTMTRPAFRNAWFEARTAGGDIEGVTGDPRRALRIARPAAAGRAGGEPS